MDTEFQKRCEIKTVISVDYDSIEKLVDRHYQHIGFKDNFELPCIEEKGNDEDWEVNLKKSTLHEYDLKYLTPNEHGRYRSYSTLTFLQDMCNKDIIPEGTYLISISW